MTDVKPVQPEKTDSPILFTEFGIVTDVKPLHRLKADSPILVTEFGIVTDVKPLHQAYLLLVDYQYYTL